MSSEPTTPEEAAGAAQRRARERQAGGEYAEAERFEALGDTGGGSLERLAAWALIEVDPGVLRSTRRFGAPITALKRFLLRLLSQHENEQAAQASRFNVALVGQLGALESRLWELERRLERLERDPRR